MDKMRWRRWDGGVEMEEMSWWQCDGKDEMEEMRCDAMEETRGM